MKEKIHNYGSITYNKKKKQIEFTYFVKDSNGEWQKRHGQEYFRNEVFIPQPKAVVQHIQKQNPELHKDIFGNPILNGITCDFYTDNLPMPVQRCPKKYSFDIDPATKFLAENFEFDPEKHEIPPLRCQYLDIETVMDDKGFIQSWNVGPDGRDGYRGGITLISSYDTHTKQTHVFGLHPYKDRKNPLPQNVSYVWCKNERGILREYMSYLKRTDPQILLGWNLCDFDLPYILNRLLYLFGKKSLYHFGNANAWIKNEARRFLLFGINAVDYMILYKKFELTPRRSYKLDDIVREEEIDIRGEGKHKYEGSLRDFCNNDWDGFVRYCVQDAELVYELDNKKKLLDTFIMCCYLAGVSFDKAMGKDVSWLRIHDAAIYRSCHSKGYYLPQTKEPDEIDFKFSGAYVMEPKPGLYDYVTVFDVASLYPSCIRALNISIDAYRGQVTKGNIIKNQGPFLVEFYSPMWLSLGEYADEIIEKYNQYTNKKVNPAKVNPAIRKFDTFEQLKCFLQERNLCIAANGAIFTKDFRGIIPSLLDDWMDIRKKNKNLYFENKQKYQQTNDEGYKILSDRYNTIQQVFKIRLNSLYGFIGSKFSRFYHVNLAEAVTATGQYVIKSTIDYLKKKNPFFASLYCDTDSIFLNYGEMLRYKGMDPTTTSKERCVEECLKIDKEVKLAIEEGLDDITKNVMLTDNYYDFETEETIEKLLITSKKKYVAKIVYDKTTQQYPEKDYTAKGMDFKKSNLSPTVKKILKTITMKIMDGMTEEQTIMELRKVFEMLPKLPISDISYVQGVRSLGKYELDSNIQIQDEKNAIAYFPKKCPYHISGAIAMNALIEWDYELNDMDRVNDGDKGMIVFVTPCNLFGVKAVTINGTWNPKLYKYFKIDIEYLMQRLILGPLTPTFEAVGFRIFMEDILQFKFVDSNNDTIQTILF